VDDIVHFIGSYAKEFIIRIPPNYTTDALQKLKAYLDAARGETQVFLEIASKSNPGQLHKVRLSKQIFLHKPLLAYIENTMGLDAWHIQ
jgi:hypothetical protein